MDLPRTLQQHPSVTVYFDGLIFLVHDEQKRLCQAAIHTRAAHHSLQIEVRRTNDDKVLFPPESGGGFNGSHRHVKAVEPLQLFVDSGSGWNPDEFSATLYKPEDSSDDQSFERVLDFEGVLYERQLKFHRNAFAVLEIAQGEFYSALTQDFLLESFPQGHPNDVAKEETVHCCSLVGADIESGGAGRSIVLRQSHPEQEIFRIELEEGAHYQIKVFNVPDKDAHAGHGNHASIAEHFLQYYGLFDLEPGERVFFVEEIEKKSAPFGGPDSPPCNTGTGSVTGSFQP
jgi:hypothetical protein